MSNSARSLSLVSNSDSILFHTSPHVIVLMPANSGTAHSSGAAKISFLSSSKSKESGKPGSFSRVKNRNSASFTRFHDSSSSLFETFTMRPTHHGLSYSLRCRGVNGSAIGMPMMRTWQRVSGQGLMSRSCSKM
jgi:hypothetical protein